MAEIDIAQAGPCVVVRSIFVFQHEIKKKINYSTPFSSLLL